jgi:serine/threonine protein phosphatase PrpC
MANTATLKPAKPQIQPDAEVSPPFAPTPKSAPVTVFAMLSDRGRVRHANQDACAALPEHGAFVVCDGIGGAAAGEVASHLAAEAFLHALSQPGPHPSRRVSPKPVSSSNSNNGAAHFPATHPHTRLHEAVRAANQAVFRHSRKSPRCHGMGTTLVSALLVNAAANDHDPTLWLAHVGDSRCYRHRRGSLDLLTEDHSLVEEQIRAGVLSRVQAGNSPIRNIITRAVGTRPTVEADIASHDAQPGDLYLLASDGLTRELTETDIAKILTQSLARTASDAALEAACQALIDAANAHGGRDNITVLLIACP